MYLSAKRRNCFLPHLLVSLDDFAVAFSNKIATVVASEESSIISPNNLKSRVGPSEKIMDINTFEINAKVNGKDFLIPKFKRIPY